MNFVFNLISQLLTAIGEVISKMDTTQWGIFASIMVIVGFMALRSRL